MNTPWIDGGVQEINGVVKFFVPPDSACDECAMTENDYQYRPAPLLGQHNEEVYAEWLGYSKEYVAQLKAEKVI